MLERIQRVHDFRLAQVASQQHFNTGYNKLLRTYRMLVRAGNQRVMPTPVEQALLDRQQHVEFGELSQQEQMRLQGEVDSLFGQIPAHLQEKARNLAGVN